MFHARNKLSKTVRTVYLSCEIVYALAAINVVGSFFLEALPLSRLISYSS